MGRLAGHSLKGQKSTSLFVVLQQANIVSIKIVQSFYAMVILFMVVLLLTR